HAPLDLARVAAPAPAGGADLLQPRDHSVHEALAHGLLLGGPVGAAAQDEGLHAVAVGTALDLQPFALRPPVAAAHVAGELLEPAARRADDVARAALLQPTETRLANHTAVQDPDAPLAAIEGLHARHDLLQGRAVLAVAGEDLVAQGV